MQFPVPPELKAHGPARIIALCNQKGGVGKTTTAINLGAALAEYGRRVLAVDFDPQGALSAGLGVRTARHPHRLRPAAGHREGPGRGHPARRDVADLDVIPANIDLSAAEVHLVNEVAREQILARVLRKVSNDYDVILIDCQPSLGLLTVNALTAAHGVLIPLECEFFALRGVALLIETIDKVRDRLNPAIKLDGILADHVRLAHPALARGLERVVEAFGDQVLDTVIGRTVKFPDATRRRRTDHPVRAGPRRRRGLPAAGPRAHLPWRRRLSPADARGRHADSAAEPDATPRRPRASRVSSRATSTGRSTCCCRSSRKHELDITEVSLSTRHRRVHRVPAQASSPSDELDQASEFLVVAATLLDLKIAGLLPQGELVDAEDVALLEARDLLFARLLQYRAFKQAADWFARALEAESTRHVRAVRLEEQFRQQTPGTRLDADRAGLRARSRRWPSRRARSRPSDSTTCTRRSVSIREQAAHRRRASLRRGGPDDLPRARSPGRSRRVS